MPPTRACQVLGDGSCDSRYRAGIVKIVIVWEIVHNRKHERTGGQVLRGVEDI